MSRWFTQDDYLDRYSNQLPVDAIRELRASRDPFTWLGLDQTPVSAWMQDLPMFKPDRIVLTEDVVTIGNGGELLPQDAERLLDVLKAFMPWRKGPFSLFGHEIDAEWRSDWKWARIQKAKASLKGKRVADVGCGNGYFMLRMLGEEPELVIGFDPYPKWWFEFQLFQRFVQSERLFFELLGAEHLVHYPGFFDTVFCLGVLYHHPDPVGLLRGLLSSLRPGGELIVECQGIAGADSMALMPRQRYGRARGFWFLPTRSCLETWLARAGFRDVVCFFDEALSSAEQRRTLWAPIDSLAEALDPQDPSRTIEGYPGPRRIYMRARR